ncbi:uncharacterized protein LOC127055059 [Gopherus flavomarginatus]|uniref:uncharacterized protein LOC127055059 n=1 Tax=Gopherus flavomarginatus TaxID=286002 RepID=UPI0021CBE99B|nr:uncharacterized protein LOC127055059 [Gopherus flavomarginatus]
MLERGHDQDALQFRVKVKELQSAYCKAREGNHRSGAAPTTCRFYKELDAILGGDPTANPRTTMDASEWGSGEGGGERRKPRVRVLEWGKTPWSSRRHAARSSSQARRKAASRSSWYLVKDKQRRGSKTPKLQEEAAKKQRRPAASSYGSLFQRESKTAELEGKGKQDSPEKRSGQEEKHKAADKHPGTPSGLYPVTRSHAGRALPCRPAPPSQSSFPCAPMSAQNPLPQHPGSYHHQLPPTPVRSPNSPENYDP